jgi:AcrR family transcriptional regulator
VATSNSAPTRRRRTPQAARQEILDAASALLAERPAHEVTVLAIMQRTTLSRKSFYVYFRDRSELILTLVRPLRREADAALATWRAAPDAVPAGRAALRAAAELYRSHGAVLRAVFWSSVEDPDLEAVRADLTAPIVEIAVRALRRVHAPPGPRDRTRPRDDERPLAARPPPDRDRRRARPPRRRSRRHLGANAGPRRRVNAT